MMWFAALLAIPLGLDLYLPVPEENPITAEKIELGRRLFHDRRLSRDGSVSCATCHDPQRAFSDARPVAVGVFGRKGRRNAPALVNRGYGRAFFWDGRARTLEEQVLKPIECTACHVGPNFTDELLHATGVAWRGGRLLDEGRGRGDFKTPTLREIARTAPYMHDGSLPTLEKVIAFYDAGGRPNPFLDVEIRPLHLSLRERRALAAFLRALSGQSGGMQR